MIERLIRYSATNRFIVLIIIAGLLIAGIWSINRIALDALPAMDFAGRAARLLVAY